MPIKASDRGLDFIRQHEKFVPKAYADGKTGKIAIGYGDTEGDTSKPLTEYEANARLLDRVKVAEQELSQNITRPLNQEQQDVLVDMHYNMGLENMGQFINTVNRGDDQQALNDIALYNKSRNAKTGELEVVPALEDRARNRQALWNNNLQLQQAGDQTANTPDLDQALKGFEPTNDLDRALEDFQPVAQGSANDPLALKNGLTLAESASSNEEAILNQQAQMMSEKLSIPVEDARAELSQKTPKEVFAAHAQSTLAEHFPVVAKFSQDPNNYVLMRDTEDWLPRMELASREVNKEKASDFEKALGANKTFIEQNLVHAGMLFGRMSVDEGIARLEQLDVQAQEGQLSSGGAQKINAAASAGNAWDLIKAMAKYPGDASLVTLQSGISSLAPFAAGVGAGVATGNPVVGAGAAYATGHFLAWGEYMQNQLEPFRNPNTGKLDLKAAFSDPARVKQWQKAADVYGGFMGLSDAAYSFLSGKILSKFAAKGIGKSVLGKAASGAAGVVAEGAASAVGEGVSQTAALTAADFYVGKLTPETFKQHVKEGKIEAVMSILPGAAMGTVGFGVKRVLRSPKDSAIKTASVGEEATKANSSAAGMENLRAVKAENKASQDNAPQVEQFINQAVTPAPIDVDINGPIIDTVDAFRPQENKQINAEAENGTVSISPMEWDFYHASTGKDGFAAMLKFSPEVQQEFARNRTSDTSVVIPTAEWLRYTEEDPGVDQIVRINGNDMNAVEGNEAVEVLDKEPFVLFEQDPTDLENASNPTQIIEPTSAEGNIISRPVELVNAFRSDEEKRVFNSLLNRLRSATKNSNVAPVSLDIIADLQLRHLRTRADALGIQVEDLAKRVQIGRSEKSGSFTPNVQPNDPYTIAFGKEATSKTVIHEFGHSWLHELAEDYQFLGNIPEEQMNDNQREYKFAMDQAAKMFKLNNIGELLNMSPAQYKKIHETFASTAEDYFLHGKFENSKVKALMETFKGFLKKIIQGIKAYPSFQITPEVERMFEAILGASNKVDEAVIPMFPIPLFDPAMLGQQGEKYMETVLDARSEAIGTTYSKAFIKDLNSREKEINKSINRIRKESTDVVDAQPAFQMLGAFKSSGTKFSYESVQSMLANGDAVMMEQIKDQVPTAMISNKKKGGLDVAQYMYMNGITNPKDMLALLLETDNRDMRIEELTNKKIDEEFPALKSDEDIHNIAVEAVQNKGKEKLLLEEMNILMTKFKATFRGLIEKAILPPGYVGKVSKELMVDQGNRIVRETNAAKFNADKFLRDSMRHGRQAARLFKAGNIQEAFDAKYKEAIHFFGYKAARDAQDAIADARSRIKTLVKYSNAKDVANKYDADIMAYGRQVVQLISAGQNIPLFTMDNSSGYSGVSIEQVEQINKARNEFIEQSQGRTGNNLSVGGAVQMGELVRTIMFVARRAKEVEIGNQKLNYNQASNQIASEVAKNNSVINLERGNLISSQNARIAFVNVRSLFESLYSSPIEFAKSTLGALYAGVRDAEATRSKAFSDANARIVKALRTTVGGDGVVVAILNPIMSRTPFLPSIDKSSKQIIAGQEGEIKFNFKNVTDLYMAKLLMGSESGAKKFLLGHGLAVIDPVTGQLDTSGWDKFEARMVKEKYFTKKHYDMFQEIWDTFETVHPLVADAMRKSDGFNMGQVKGKAFKNDFGEYRGGYVPVSEIKDALHPGAIDSLLSVDTQAYQAIDLYPSMNTGMTNERSKTYYPVNLDMSRLTAYLSAAMNIAYLRNPLLDFGRVIKSPSVMTALETRRPGAVKNVIAPWFESVKNQTYTERSTAWDDKLARKLRSNVNLSMYILNFMSSGRQYLGLAPVAAKVKPHHLLSGSIFGTATPFATREFMREKSKFMAQRAANSQKDFIRSWDQLDTNFDWINWTDEKVQAFTYMFSQATQNHVDVMGWTGAYKQAIAKGLNESQAIIFADDVIESTQSAATVTSMSNAQKGTDLKKLLTMVSSVPIAMHNLVQTDVMRSDSKLAKAKAVILLGIVTTILPTLLDSKLTDLIEGEDEDEDDKSKQQKDQDRMTALALRTLGGSLDTVLPIYMRPVSGAISFGVASVSPALSKLNKLPNAVKGVEHLTKGVDLSASEVASLMDTFTIFTGVPASVIGKGVLAEEIYLATKQDLHRRKDIRRAQLQELREREQ